MERLTPYFLQCKGAPGRKRLSREKKQDQSQEPDPQPDHGKAARVTPVPEEKQRKPVNDHHPHQEKKEKGYHPVTRKAETRVYPLQLEEIEVGIHWGHGVNQENQDSAQTEKRYQKGEKGFARRY